MPEPEDVDDFPNDFDGFDFDGIPLLQAPPSGVHPPASPRDPSPSRSIVPRVLASPVLSPSSDSTEDIDPAFLAAVDALEARALRKTSKALESPAGQPMHPHNGTVGTGQSCEHSEEPFSATKKGKRKADPQGDIDVRAILAEYENELTCPICCDLLVGAQVTNPCGHTCCGECGYRWLARNKHESTCAICRARLSSRKPLLPNFSADNLVRQHLQVLAKIGRPDWQEKGYKTIEWNKRLESWKKTVAARAVKERSEYGFRRRQQRFYEVEEYWLVDESTDDVEEASISRVTPRRGTRSRR